MGKIKPPAEVFNEWTPQQQERYKASVDGMAEERDAHAAESDRLEASAQEHNANREQYLAEGDDYGNKCALQEEELANRDAQQAAQERAKAQEMDAQVNSLKMDDPGSDSGDTEQARQQYQEAVNAQMEADQAQMAELQKQEAELQQKQASQGMFSDGSQEQLAQVQERIAQLQDDMDFNSENQENSQPAPPEAPPAPPEPPTPPAQYFVTAGAKLTCPFAMGGMASLTVLPSRATLAEGPPLANIQDYKPMVNVPTFGMCNSMANPQVAAATAAAMGALTPMPCIPNIVAPWTMGKMDFLIENQPVLLSTATLQCLWGGVITIMP